MTWISSFNAGLSRDSINSGPPKCFAKSAMASEYCTGLEKEAISFRRYSKVFVSFGAGRRSLVK